MADPLKSHGRTDFLVTRPTFPTDPTVQRLFRNRPTSFRMASRLWTTGQTIYPKGFVWLTASQSYYQNTYPEHPLTLLMFLL